MSQFNFKKLIPYLLPIILFAAIAMIYFYPALLGYKLKQTDIKQHKGMAHEIVSHRDKFDEEPLWIGNMFAGMPSYQVSKVKYSGSVMPFLTDLTQLWLPHPIGILFAYMLGFFIFSLALRIDPLTSLIGAIAYGFSSYFIIIIEAGHNTKALALAYLPPMIGGIITILRGRLLIGALLTVIFLGLELYANHLQITYYSIIIILAIGIVELIHQIKKSNTLEFFKRVGILLAAVLIAVLPNIGNLITTYEYSKASTRSPSELTITSDGQSNEKIKSTGLDKDYITRWSYGIEETATLILPNAKGGGSGAIIGDQKEVERLRKENPQFFNFLVKQYQESQNIINTYWGNQPFTSGSVYLGIIVCFLAFLSFFFVKDRLILAFAAASILTLFLSWGKNLMWLTDFFIDYIPLYNKFRAVSMILIVLEFTIPVFAILFISKLIKSREAILKERKRLLIASGSFIGVLLLFWITPSSFFSFISDKEQSLFNSMIQNNPSASNYINSNLILLEQYRVEVFQADVIRGLQFIIGAVLLLGLFLVGKIKKTLLLAGLGILILADLWSVDKKYINNETTPNTSKTANNRFVMYQKSLQKKAPYDASQVDQAILARELQENPELAATIQSELTKLKNTNPRPSAAEVQDIQFMELMRGTHYRVLNSIKKMDEDAETAYFHKTLGGYHGAKMKKYQELIDFELGEEHFQLRQAFLQGGNEMAKSLLPSMNVTNMLNAKYIIGAVNLKGGQSLTFIENPYALGNAWFVNEIEWVDSANDEIMALKDLNSRDKVVIRSDYQKQFDQADFNRSANSSIQLTSYSPNELRYRFNAPQDQLAVFSEIYYESGWNAYVNGEKLPYFKANYILRGMIVPKGEGEIVFKFEPITVEVGEKLTWASSIIILLLIAGVLYRSFNNKGNQEEISQ